MAQTAYNYRWKKIVKTIITKNNVGESPAFRGMFETLRDKLQIVPRFTTMELSL